MVFVVGRGAAYFRWAYMWKDLLSEFYDISSLSIVI